MAARSSPGIAAKKAAKPAMGRPRKYSDEDIVDAALRVMEREGYGALTIRSLAQELGTSHSTLYNYVGHIEDIEDRALHKLTEQLPMPSASVASELRLELVDYLLSTRRFLAQHPGVLYPPIGSAAFNTLHDIGEQWIAAITPHAPDEQTARLGLAALVSLTSVAAERERIYGPDAAEQLRIQVGSTRGLDTMESALDRMMKLVLPGLSKTRKGGRK